MIIDDVAVWASLTDANHAASTCSPLDSTTSYEGVDSHERLRQGGRGKYPPSISGHWKMCLRRSGAPLTEPDRHQSERYLRHQDTNRLALAQASNRQDRNQDDDQRRPRLTLQAADHTQRMLPFLQVIANLQLVRRRYQPRAVAMPALTYLVGARIG